MQYRSNDEKKKKGKKKTQQPPPSNSNQSKLNCPCRQTKNQVRVNESCSASVKTDLLRRLRRLNQGQRRATRIEPGARCSYGMCLMPLAGPPAGLGGTAAADRTPSVRGRGWGRGRRRGRGSTAAGGDTGRGRGSGGRGGGSHVFPCGHMFHEFCLGVSSEGGWRGGRGAGSGGEVSASCSLCSRGKSGGR